MIDTQTITLVVLLVTFSGGLVWQLSRVEKSLGDKINEAKDEVERRQDTHLREFGETVSAIRSKINEVELFAANNYVKRDGFYKVQEQIGSEIRSLGDKIEARFVRLETKIDTKT
jgi:hypothetical protein